MVPLGHNTCLVGTPVSISYPPRPVKTGSREKGSLLSDLPRVFSVAALVSTVVGLVALISAGFIWYAFRSKSISLRAELVGTGVATTQFEAILKTFTDDDQRLKALSRLLSIESNQAEAILQRIKTIDSSARRRNDLLLVGGVLLLIAVVAVGGKFVTQNEDPEILNEARKNLSMERYDAALERAEQVLAKDRTNVYALNIKGTVEFYEMEYAEAAKSFGRALEKRPKDRMLQLNLGRAYIESGNCQLALGIFRSLQDGSPLIQYYLGSSFLCSGNYDSAAAYAHGLPTGIYEGQERILEAAALAGLERSHKAEKAQVVELLRVGISSDSTYWHNIFRGGRDIHISYSHELSLLRSYYHDLELEKREASL